jgi:putative isomerase
MYKELLAMAYVMDAAGNKERSDFYKTEASGLKDAINEHLYDEKCGMYFSADLNLVPIDPNRTLHRGKPRHWDCLSCA